MIDKLPFSLQSIIQCLDDNYNILTDKLTLLPIGADMDACVFKAETKSCQSYFVKLRRSHHYDVSVSILTLLQASGIQQIIAPIKTNSEELTQRINDFTLTVFPFVNGQNGFCYKLNDEQWITLGKALRQVHEFIVPVSIKNQIRVETYSDKWRKSVLKFYTHINQNLECDETALKLQSFMMEHRSLIHHLVNRADTLEKKILKQSNNFVLCHSDIHGGNVLIDEKDLIFIVDWDDPILAPKERDLMFIGGGVANIWNNPREEESFYKGYGKTEINWPILTYYRYERIVQDIAEYVQSVLINPIVNRNRVELFEQFKDMFEPNGVVDIALKTDRYFNNTPDCAPNP